MSDSRTSPAETFATYLAKYYVGRKGFGAGTVPEAAALAEACDIVVTRSDGMTFEIVGIVDREAHPQKTFGMSRETLEGIGEQCLKYSGTVSGQKLPVTISIMEVGPGPATEQDRLRLKPLKRRSPFSKVVLVSWKLDTTASKAWTNAPFWALFLASRTIERLMREPRLADESIRQPEVALARQRFPLLSVSLLVVLIAVFACEIVLGIGPWSGLLAPSIQTLVALGGLNRTLVLQGEWHRIFSAVLLHADALHLVLNGFCLYLAGTVLESLIGRRWFCALFVIGAASGSLMSLAINPASLVSVGASGAIMGLLAGAFVCSFRYPPGAVRMQIQVVMLQVLIPSLIPLAVSRTGQQVDFAAHLGGALSGAIVGFAMLKTWLPASPRPRLLPLAAALSAAGALIFALSMLPAVRDYHKYAQEQALNLALIPNDQIPNSNEQIKAKAADLLARYPRDPRARLYHAGVLIDKGDLSAAERDLRAGLAEEEILRTRFKPELEARMRGLLALILIDTNRPAEAKTVVQPACSTIMAGTSPMRDLLLKAQLCDKTGR